MIKSQVTTYITNLLCKLAMTNDLNIFKKLIPGQINQIFMQDNKITLLRCNFKLKNYEKLTQKERNGLSTTACCFFKFLYDFGRYIKIRNTVKVVTVDDHLKSFETNYCGSFQMYFYLDLSEPVKDSAVAEPSSKNLDIKLIDTSMNEMLNTETQQNERILDAFMLQHSIEFNEEEVYTKRWSQKQKIKPHVILIISL